MHYQLRFREARHLGAPAGILARLRRPGRPVGGVEVDFRMPETYCGVTDIYIHSWTPRIQFCDCKK